jgi:hypothetical protein
MCLTVWRNPFRISAENQDTLNQVLAITSSHSTRAVLSDRPQFRHYKWRKQWHGFSAFSTKTNIDVTHSWAPTVLLSRQHSRFVFGKSPVRISADRQPQGFSWFSSAIVQKYHSSRKQQPTTASFHIIPKPTPASCLGRLQFHISQGIIFLGTPGINLLIKQCHSRNSP